ncbi:hypothetical protein [Rhizobium leguminosarum]|uniref:hypothetical protein n=1 Tax=Rhizobium leguminosarum TaxID=384 RepID=UPI0012BD5EB7|nr:hypothetical protein [Rhizobium leguminosarum]
MRLVSISVNVIFKAATADQIYPARALAAQNIVYSGNLIFMTRVEDQCQRGLHPEIITAPSSVD